MREKRRKTRRSRRAQEDRIAAIAIVTGVLLAAILLLLIIGSMLRGTGEDSRPSTASETTPQAAGDLTVAGISLNGMTREEAAAALSESVSWSLSISCGDESVPVENLAQEWIRAFVDRLYQEGASGAYELSFEGIEEQAERAAKEYGAQWETKPRESVLDHFDPQTGEFVFTEGCAGTAVDQEELTSQIAEAVKAGQFDAVIQAKIVDVEPELTAQAAQARYRTLDTFITETTDNEKRNTNVRLAAQALNGTIVKPGEEFSFNAVVGQRTAEKGYQEAAAYNSGEVVQEIGGGVCQISSTLYRAAFRSGMEITFRRSHTFEPNYVTPGQDAAISWEQPDFRFVNTSEAPIGIRASYENRRAAVSIYGIPVLEEGVSWDLYSEKVEELDPPEPTYIEDASLAPGTERVQKAATNGSRWVTYKVVTKDGAEIERTEDHTKTYKGHAAVIRRNTGTAATVDPTVPAEETGVDGMPPNYQPGGGSAAAASRPAQETTAQSAAAETAAAQSTAAQSAAARPTAAQSTAAARPTAAPTEPAPAQETAPPETTAAQPAVIEPIPTDGPAQ